MASIATSAVADEIGDPPGADRAASRFFTALAVATVLPLLLLPFYAAGRSEHDFPLAFLFVWMLAGYGHVMSTAWFGFDDDYRGTLRTYRVRIYGALATIPLALGVMAIASPAASAWLFAGFIVWQAHHFNRQNYGILSLAAVRDGARLPQTVGPFLLLSTMAGAIRAVTMPGLYPFAKAPLPLHAPAIVAWGFWAALLCLAAAAGLLAWTVLTHPGVRRSPTVLLFLVLSLGFFAPSLLTDTAPVVFWPFAMAHGLQYLIITGVLARRSRRGARGLALFLGLALVLGLIAAAMTAMVPFAQVYAGLVVAHFVADARLWRLRDPAVRDVARRRFDFVFVR